MHKWQQRATRAVLGVGLVAWVAWLVWRAGWSLTGSPLWLWIPALAVEAGGVAGAAFLAWALWPRAVAHPSPADPDAAVAGPVDVVVRVGDHRDDEARATLLALTGVRGVASTTVVDLAARPSVAAVAAEFGAVYVAPDPGDFNGLGAAAAAGSHPYLLLLDAGDVPAGDIVRRLRTELRDPTVAVVQGLGVAAPGDSPEHGPAGHHDLRFERAALNPALGRLGVAMWTGSGSLVRRAALADARLGTEPSTEAHLLASAALLRRGWRIVAPAGMPVLALRSLTRPDDIYDDRVRRARAARRALLGPDGLAHADNRRRAALLAWSVRPLSGLRRGVFLAVLLVAIQAGRMPMHAATWAVAGLWAPGFALTAAGLAMASGWTLRPGDRTRWSLQTFGAAYRSLVERDPVPSARPVVLASPEARHHSALVGAVVLLSAVMALRGVSDQFTHALHRLDHGALVALTAIALWTLGMSLDALRLLARRNLLRRAPRLPATLPAQLGERSVNIVDLTPLGAGVTLTVPSGGSDPLHVGQHLPLSTTLSTASGCIDVELDSTVRNLRRAGERTWHVGVEFGAPTPAVASALAELCVVQPARLLLADQPRHADEPLDRTGSAQGGTRHLLLRLTALAAVAGAVATTAPGRVEADDFTDRVLSGEIQVDVSTPPETATTEPLDEGQPVPPFGSTTNPIEAVPVVVVAVCSHDAGADGVYGTLDDVYGQPVTTTVGQDGTYQLPLDGEACWAGLDLPEGYQFATDEADAASQPALHTIDLGLPSPTFDARLRSTGPDAASSPAPTASGAIRVDPRGRWTPPAESSTPAEQVLPRPDPAATAPHARPAGSTIVVTTLLLAAGLAVSIALGTVRPGRRDHGVPDCGPARQSIVSGSPSPDLAMR